ncbi:hypothetical protein [Pseudozobellia thermophila]|uniref:Outer membrane protein beta-barrel domain-containing protein n=1 Tax=Pseudozobellia thermophila TaxID=192903 RepID=A0A1M6F3X2_9FLAO|nr:hypothetical protein [Pseudozobellia thermophila]SHI92375.1 hypothetical protein SAMN04488513_102286 [Pseudozobellia thermophila]
MKNYFLAIALTLVGFETLAQFDYREGYIINNLNDTIYGYIDYRGNQSNAKKCVFKKTKNSDSRSYSPKELKAYSYENGRYYLSKPLNLDGKEDTFFLEYLFEGAVDFFYLNLNGRDHYLASDESGTLSLLKNEEREIVKNGKKYVLETKEFRTTLSLIFHKSAIIQKEVRTLSLNRNSLVKIAKKYHKEVAGQEPYYVHGEKASTPVYSYGPLIGINMVNISHGDNLQDRFYYFRGSLSSPSFSPSIGFFFKTNFPRINEKINLQWFANFYYENLEWAHDRQETLYHFTEINNISSKRWFWSNNLSIKYEFPRGKVKPTFQIGAFNNLELSSSYKQEYELRNTNGITTRTDESTTSPFSKLNLGFSLGAGIKTMVLKKEIYLDLVYNRSGILDKFEGLNQNMLALNIGIPLQKGS